MWNAEKRNGQGYSGQPVLWQSHLFSSPKLLGDWLLELFQHSEVHDSFHAQSSAQTISNCIIKL